MILESDGWKFKKCKRKVGNLNRWLLPLIKDFMKVFHAKIFLMEHASNYGQINQNLFDKKSAASSMFDFIGNKLNKSVLCGSGNHFADGIALSDHI